MLNLHCAEFHAPSAFTPDGPDSEQIVSWRLNVFFTSTILSRSAHYKRAVVEASFRD